MTSHNNSYPTIKGYMNGVICKTDYGLYHHSIYRSRVETVLLSIYGATQQVRALFSLLSMGHRLIYVDPKDERAVSLHRARGGFLRFKGFNIGWGKQHALIWNHETTDNKDVIFWFSPNEKEAAMMKALSKKRIPLLKEWLPWLEPILVEHEYLIPLTGWGGINGYLLENTSDNHICDLICEDLKKTK